MLIFLFLATPLPLVAVVDTSEIIFHEVLPQMFYAYYPVEFSYN